MTLEEAKERSQELYDLAATLNSKVKAAAADGLHTALFLAEMQPTQLIVLSVTISPNKLTA